MNFITNTTADLPNVAAQLVAATAPCRIFTLTGEMGAGKTTFVAAIAQHLGITEPTSSPTYSIVQEYESADSSTTVLHLDLYRLKTIEEALDIGIEDLLDRQNVYVFIEWADLIVPLLPDDAVHIRIAIEGEEARRIEWTDVALG
jgi:tRNA threonylcarbamoyladenosine biosynthesis protein TsaE